MKKPKKIKSMAMQMDNLETPQEKLVMLEKEMSKYFLVHGKNLMDELRDFVKKQETKSC